MKIGGHPLRQHLRLLAPLFALLAGVWVLRWIIGCVDTPGWLMHVVSLTVFSPVAILLAVLMLHVRRFGGYASVAVCSLLLTVWTELLIVLAILFTALTGIPNPYMRDPYVMSWFLGIQREIRRDLVIDANYVGTAGRKLFRAEDWNRFTGDRSGAESPTGEWAGDTSWNRINL